MEFIKLHKVCKLPVRQENFKPIKSTTTITEIVICNTQRRSKRSSIDTEVEPGNRWIYIGRPVAPVFLRGPTKVTYTARLNYNAGELECWGRWWSSRWHALVCGNGLVTVINLGAGLRVKGLLFRGKFHGMNMESKDAVLLNCMCMNLTCISSHSKPLDITRTRFYQDSRSI